MQKFPLGQLVKIKTGKLDANAKVDGGQYPFFTCSKDVSRIDSYTYDCECVLVAGNGDLNVKYYNGKFDAYQRTYIIEDNKTQELDIKYLYYFMQSYIETLRSQTIGGVIQYIKLNNLTDIDFPLPPLPHQKQIIQKLDTLTNLINLRKLSIEKTEKLTKSIFIEMFGDPMINEKGWEVKTFGDGIDILTDYHANGSYEILRDNVKLLDNPDYALMVRTTDLENNNFINGVKYIDEHAYNFLSKSKIFGGEIIINKIGSAGETYLMPYLSKPVSMGMNAFLIRTNKQILLEIFTFYYLKTSYIKSIIESKVLGAVTKTITKDAIRSIPFILPPISLQNKFASIVEKNEENIRKQKKSLKKLEELYSGVMQESFRV